VFGRSKTPFFWLRAVAIFVAYALVFRLATPMPGVAATSFDVAAHVLCLSAATDQGSPVAPEDQRHDCDQCCLAATPAALAPPDDLARIEPIARRAGLDAFIGVEHIRGPPPAEAWGAPRAQRGPPSFP
jgi:hypothetical protein